MFETANDGNMRLRNTVIRYKGRPVFCEGVDDDLRLHCMWLHDGKNIRIAKNDPELDYSASSLGMVNSNGEAIFCSRVPCRKWKQGLGRENVSVKGLGRDRPREVNGLIRSKSLGMTIENKFPSMEACLKMLRTRQVASVAFSRKFAVRRIGDKIALYFRTRIVGEIKEDKPSLDDRYNYLQEVLQEAIGHA